MNTMCKNCTHLDRSCPGTASDVWTGCILKDRPEEEAAEYIDEMTKLITGGEDHDITFPQPGRDAR